MGLISISKDIYNDNLYKQEPYLCCPTCFSIITSDLTNNKFNIKPIKMLSLMLFKENNVEFFIDPKSFKYYYKKYKIKFNVSKNKRGIYINSNNINKILLLILFLIKVEYDLNFNKELDNNYIPAKKIKENLELEEMYNIININRILNLNNDRNFYIIAYLNYTDLIKDKNKKFPSFHSVILNKINNDYVELLVPHENKKVKKERYLIKDFLNSFNDGSINKLPYGGIDIIYVNEK